MSKNNEIVACKASGISLYRLAVPLLIAGLALAGSMIVLDDTFFALCQPTAGRTAQSDQGPPSANVQATGALDREIKL